MNFRLSIKFVIVCILLSFTFSLYGQLELLPDELQFASPMKIKTDGSLPSSLILENNSVFFFSVLGSSVPIYGDIVHNTNGRHVFKKNDQTIMQIDNDMKGSDDANVIVDENGTLKRGTALDKYYTVTGLDISHFNSPSFNVISLPPDNTSGAGDREFYMPVHLPDGVTISSLTVNYIDNHISDDLILGLYSFANSAGVSPVTHVEHTSAGSDTPFPNYSIFLQMNPITIDNLSRTYYVKVGPKSGTWPGNNNNLSFVSASIKYR